MCMEIPPPKLGQGWCRIANRGIDAWPCFINIFQVQFDLSLSLSLSTTNVGGKLTKTLIASVTNQSRLDLEELGDLIQIGYANGDNIILSNLTSIGGCTWR